MKLLIITELQVQDLIDTLKDSTVKGKDLVRCLSVLQTLQVLPKREEEKKEEKPTNVTMEKDASKTD